MFRVSRLLVAAALTFAVASQASAAAVLAPLFTVPGVMNTANLGTYFTCTNTDTIAVTVGISGFNQSGTQVTPSSANAVSLAPKATVMFGTQGAGGLAVDAVVAIGPNITKGSATIDTTSKKVVCSVFVADNTANPPSVMTTLTIVAKGKQKGD